MGYSKIPPAPTERWFGLRSFEIADQFRRGRVDSQQVLWADLDYRFLEYGGPIRYLDGSWERELPVLSLIRDIELIMDPNRGKRWPRSEQ